MARHLPQALLNKLDKLFPLFSSDKDGEMQAACRAASRLLKSEGYDWHDYIETRRAQPVATTPPPWHPPPRTGWDDGDFFDEPAKPRDTRHDSYVAASVVLALCQQIRTRHPRLNRTSVGYLDQREQLADRNPHVRFSPKQWTWLRDLAQQAGVTLDDA